MNKQKTTGLLVNGSVKSAGVTFYTRRGKTVLRSSHSDMPLLCSRAQFDMRMRMKHAVALWHVLSKCGVLCLGDRDGYHAFTARANRLPTVYLPKRGPLSCASLLMPQMPVSQGLLPAVGLRLSQAGGVPALVTDIVACRAARFATFWFYTFCQHVDGSVPTLTAEVRQLCAADMQEADGCLALPGDEFADPLRGWALVRVEDDHCSTQSVVTNCTYYERFTTDEAFIAAAREYGVRV